MADLVVSDKVVAIVEEAVVVGSNVVVVVVVELLVLLAEVDANVVVSGVVDVFSGSKVVLS